MVSWANAAAQQALGAAPGLSAATLWTAPTAPAPDSLLPDLQSALDGQHYRVTRAPLPAGASLWTLQATQDLHEAKAELQHQQELMDLAREFGRLGVWERNVRTLQGRWDSQVLRFWGMDPDDPTPDFAKAAERVLPEDRELTDGIFLRSLAKAGHYSMRYRVRSLGGELRRIHSQWVVKNGSDGQPERVLGVMMDDTEPYALAHAAQDLQSQLALTVQVSGMAIWRHDLASGRMHYSDEGWRALGLQPRPQGLSLDEVRALIHPDDLPAVVASAAAAMRSAQPVDLEARYRHSDGSWRHQMLRRTVLRDDQGRPTAFLGVAMDVTERLQERARADELMQRFETVTRAAGIGHWLTEPGQEHPTWSEQLRRMFGLPPQGPLPTLGDWLKNHVHPEDMPALRQALVDWGASGPGHLETAFRVRRANGEVRQIHSHASAEQTERGMRRFGVLIDVTDRRTAETARQEREVALRESEAKSQFMARMSHELRTPLNAVLGFAQLLLADELSGDRPDGPDGPSSASRRRRLAHILSAGQHLLSLINDVLQLSGVAGGEVRVDLAPVPLQGLLDSTLPLLGPLLDGRDTSVSVGPLQQAVMADATRLRQVLLNLLSNAIKYNRPGGQVRVSAQRQGGRVRLQVADDGCGMDDAQLRHLFEPFNRLGADRGAVEGTGIGLAIVKALVQRMGGSVSVTSTPGQGSVFQVELAAADTLPAAPVPAAAHPAPQRPGSRQPLRQLLYIEDNPVNALIIGELLDRRGDLKLHVAVDGGSGVAQARALQPDLILLDMQLPDFDGYEVLRRLRADADTAAIPCIALSANAMPQDIERALKAGVSDYWTKPLDFKAFMASLETLFGKPAP